jgi:hypothetical protein
MIPSSFAMFGSLETALFADVDRSHLFGEPQFLANAANRFSHWKVIETL